jgi:calcium-dependent protein kinase
MASSSAGAVATDRVASLVVQGATPTVADLLSDCPQPDISRSKSSNFHFQYNFSRDNPGSLKDHYTLQAQTLGEGSFGSARIATCLSTGLVRAVKTIKIKAVKDPKRLEMEISIAKQLDHPNVVRLFETFHENEKLHIVMELCTGGELFDRIIDAGSRGFDESMAAKYVKWMMTAIAYLHAHNVAHRDVKPENFLFQSRAQDAQLKSIDFGLAKIFEPGQVMTTRVGTAYYVAPEVLKGCYDERCDVWGVGVIAYLMLCGYAPFNGADDAEVLKKVRKGVVQFTGPSWGSISGAAKAAIQYMMTMNASERPAAAQVMDDSWVREVGLGVRPATKIPDVVERLQQFRQHARMKRVALTAVAQQLPESETKRLGELFQSMDRNGDGELSAEEVRQGLEAQGIQVPEALEEILRSVDVNGSGTLDYTEFVAAMMDEQLLNKRSLCRAAFRAFDLDGDGVITGSELGQVLHSSSFGSSPCTAISQDRIDNIIREVDGNGDGGIDFQEFCDMLSPSKKGERKSRTAPAVQAASWAQQAANARGAQSERHLGQQRGFPSSGAAAEEQARPEADEKARGWRGSAGWRIRNAISSARSVKFGLARRSSGKDSLITDK